MPTRKPRTRRSTASVALVSDAPRTKAQVAACTKALREQTHLVGQMLTDLQARRSTKR